MRQVSNEKDVERERRAKLGPFAKRKKRRTREASNEKDIWLNYGISPNERIVE